MCTKTVNIKKCGHERATWSYCKKAKKGDLNPGEKRNCGSVTEVRRRTTTNNCSRSRCKPNKEFKLPRK